MDQRALESALQRIAGARGQRLDDERTTAALERTRAELHSLGRSATMLEHTLPDRVGDAVQEGLRREVLPVARHIAEIRGLLNTALRRLDRLEELVIAERHARIDDLALLVDLVSSGWQGIDRRLERLETGQGGAVVPLRVEGERLAPAAGEPAEATAAAS